MQTAIPEYMKVRSYLYKLIMNSDGSSLKIPSENELCRLFDVSRITVRGAIKGLIEDKYLVSKRGIGTFINYARIKNQAQNWPNIGFIKGDGKHATNMFDTSIIDCIIQSGMNAELLYLPESNKLQTFLEIVKNGINGLIWQHSSTTSNNMKYIEALQNAGIPLLLIEEEASQFPCDLILSSRLKRGQAIANYMHSKGHHNILFIHNDPSTEKHFEENSTYYGFCQQMTEHCGEAWGCMTNNITHISELAEKLNKTSHFTAVYSGNYLVAYVVKELQSRNIKIPEDMSYLVFNPSNPFFFKGFPPDTATEENLLQRTIIEWLHQRIANKDMSGIFSKTIDLEITSGKTVLPIKAETVYV